ncbi:acetyl-CoA carboxylase carboxyl transferase subunit beta [Candidatus Marinamargulisbacteria bacterium SCGC AG-333-B06]|nr:acetyl-CoA carboxylase carboxyl transferase subunit beta [Candidatus Marinamargulisbacteria bacterium SCGC AG-333-B06]
MSILDWFEKKQKKAKSADKLNIPGNLWLNCPKCSEVTFRKDLENNMMVCLSCKHHFRISPQQRLEYTFDADSFEEYDNDLEPTDFLDFVDTEPYVKRIKKTKKKTAKYEAIVTGTAKLSGKPVNVGIMDFSYMGGSMGAVVGEKLTRLIERSVADKLPLIVFTMSGGARMQEGIVSLMQMAKTSAALARLNQERILYISVLCDPTTGGTSASFAMLGDVQIAEPGALISFAGPRVIEQTIKQKLPAGFQRAEFLLEHGMVDMVVERKKLRDMLTNIVTILDFNEGSYG